MAAEAATKRKPEDIVTVRKTPFMREVEEDFLPLEKGGETCIVCFIRDQFNAGATREEICLALGPPDEPLSPDTLGRWTADHLARKYQIKSG